MDIKKKFSFPIEIKEPRDKRFQTKTGERYQDVWYRDAEAVIRGLMRFAGLSEEDMTRPASRETLLNELRYYELYKKAKDQPHTHWVPDGWKIHVATNAVAANYHDGPPGDEPFFVPTICLWEQNGPLVTRWTRDAAFRAEIGGFVRYDRWSCGYCGEHIPPDWEGPYCPYCGAS